MTDVARDALGVVVAPGFTERQAKGWEEHVKPILERHGIPSHTPFQLFGHWHVKWGEEVRPGRGHFFDGYYADGEHFVQVMMDVYGYPSVSIAELDWVHADSDEELVCETCKAAHKHKMRFVSRFGQELDFECQDIDCPEGYVVSVVLWGSDG